MRSNDSWDFTNLLGPRNLEQEIETVDDVGFDLRTLFGAEASFRNGKITDFIPREHRPLDASRVMIGLPCDLEKTFKLFFREHCRLVGLQDGFEAAFQLSPAKAVLLFQGRDAGQGLR